MILKTDEPFPKVMMRFLEMASCHFIDEKCQELYNTYKKLKNRSKI